MYQPSEDSYFLSEQLEKFLEKEKNKKIKILDLGSGSGIQAEACLELEFNNIVCSDIDEESINYLRNKFKFEIKNKKIKVVKSNLFKNVREIKLPSSDFSEHPENPNKTQSFLDIKEKFDLIVFNPPYLKENKYDKKKDTSGGKQGDETIFAFLKQAKKHLKEKGKILLLLSSLTPGTKIEKIIREGYKKKKLAEKPLFFEKLEVWLLEINR